MKGNKREDLRKRKTKSNLYKSFIKLIKQKSFIHITITDICEDAKINRSTFYDHFKDKYELLESLVEDSNAELKSRLASTEKHHSIKSLLIDHLDVLLKYLEENKEIYSILISIKKTSLVFSSLLDSFKEEVVQSANNDTKQMILLFYSSASIGFIVEQLRDIHSFQKDKVLKQLKKLIPDLDTKK